MYKLLCNHETAVAVGWLVGTCQKISGFLVEVCDTHAGDDDRDTHTATNEREPQRTFVGWVVGWLIRPGSLSPFKAGWLVGWLCWLVLLAASRLVG